MILTVCYQTKNGTKLLRQKICLMVKLTIVFLLLFTYQVCAKSYGQKVTIIQKNHKLSSVLKEIEKQTGFMFFYDKALIEKITSIDVSVINSTLDEALVACLRDRPLTFTIVENTIVIQQKEVSLPLVHNIEMNIEATSPTVEVRGRVLNQEGKPLDGVSVTVKGANIGTSADKSGNYLINAPKNGTLVFSYVGYIKKEVPVGGRTEINVVMESSISSLDQVVVVGYGTVRKATLTGAVTSVKGAELVKSPSTNLSNSLSGRLPGLTVVTRSGEPGNDGSILRIRGSNTLNDNSPLVVVDGIAGRQLERIDPSDIESITILKDASAAIYGARAANGVILITTKRGSTSKPQTYVSFNQAWVSPTMIPKMTDAATYAEMINEVNLYRGRSELYTPEMIQKYKDGSDPLRYPNTDWLKEVFKPSSLQNYANASITGGSDNVRYMVSAGTKFQDATYRNSATNYSQVNFRGNLDIKLNNYIKVSLDLSGRQENRNYPTLSSGTIFNSTLRGKPNLRAYWPNGLPGPDPERGENPVVLVTDKTGYDKGKTYMLESVAKIDIAIPWVKGLSVTGNVSFDKTMTNEKLWQKPWSLYYWDGVSLEGTNQPKLFEGVRGYSEPRLTQSMIDGSTITMNTLINYATTISKRHNIKILAGAENIKGESMNFSAFRRYFITSAADQLFAGGDLNKDNSGSASVTARQNYFGRVNYNFSEKYLAEFVFRSDGSYIFPEKKRFGFFPGISLGWRISEENFWKKHLSSTINDLKFRGSWGKTGNDRIAPYQYLSSYGFSGVAIFNDGVENKALTELRIPNPNVTWEIATQANIGFDALLLDSKISITADYFNNLRSNILWWKNASVPSTAGLTLPQENIGKVRNEGFDFAIGYHHQTGEFRYSISINGGYQKNKILFWDEAPGAPKYQQSTDHPMGSNLYYKAIGIFKDQASIDAQPHSANARPGDVIFEDVNKDGQINDLDKIRNDKTDIPTFSGGMNIDLQYKNFSLSVLIQGAAGAARYCLRAFNGESGNYFQSDANGRWTTDNTNATKPRTWNFLEEYWRRSPNTYWLINSDYIRLKNVELGYSFPKSFNKRLGIKGSNIYLSGLNLLTIDKLVNWDPETVGDSPYPSNKVLNLGLKITF